MQMICQKTKNSIIFVTHRLSESTILGNKVVVFTHRPSTIKKIIPIDYKRPRLVDDESLISYQKEISALLRPEVKGKGDSD